MTPLTNGTAPVRRDGPDAYDDLLPDLRAHAGARPGEPGYRERRDALVEAFLTEPFSGDERHQRRIDLLAAYEDGRDITSGS